MSLLQSIERGQKAQKMFQRRTSEGISNLNERLRIQEVAVRGIEKSLEVEEAELSIRELELEAEFPTDKYSVLLRCNKDGELYSALSRR